MAGNGHSAFYHCNTVKHAKVKKYKSEDSISILYIFHVLEPYNIVHDYMIMFILQIMRSIISDIFYYNFVTGIERPTEVRICFPLK